MNARQRRKARRANPRPERFASRVARQLAHMVRERGGKVLRMPSKPVPDLRGLITPRSDVSPARVYVLDDVVPPQFPTWVLESGRRVTQRERPADAIGVVPDGAPISRDQYPDLWAAVTGPTIAELKASGMLPGPETLPHITDLISEGRPFTPNDLQQDLENLPPSDLETLAAAVVQAAEQFDRTLSPLREASGETRFKTLDQAVRSMRNYEDVMRSQARAFGVSIGDLRAACRKYERSQVYRDWLKASLE